MASHAEPHAPFFFLQYFFPIFGTVSHKGIVSLFEDVSKKLGDDIKFVYGRESDFNQLRINNQTAINLSPLRARPSYTDNDTQNYAKVWFVAIGFYKVDKIASTPVEYQKILDDLDEMVDKFVNTLNFYMLKSDSIVIRNMDQAPFIKALSDQLTGYILTFDLQINDDFNYCGLNDC